MALLKFRQISLADWQTLEVKDPDTRYIVYNEDESIYGEFIGEEKVTKEVEDLVDNKVDKVEGKGLSTEDYTVTEKNKLSGIEEGAEVNVQSDWNAISGDALILNKPYIPSKVSDLTNDTGYITGYTETDPIFTAWDKSTGISITKSQVSDLIEATQTLSGLMSATDKQRLDVLHALLEENEANSVVDSINEVLAIFNNYPEGADLVTALAGKVDKVTGKGLSTNDLTNTLKSNYDTAYSWGNHGVEGYLKAITKAMVETVLIGTITSHNHNGVYEPANSNIQSHISSISNPHNVSKSQVGLGNVDNTSDLDKPISTAQQTALDNKVDKVAGKALSTNDYTNNDKQSVEKIPTIEQDILDLESGKVDKVSGMGLSSNDFTTAEKNKLAGLTVGLTVEEWSTATKTLALSDANKLFKCSHTANQTLTIPTNATVAFPIGTMITFLLTSTNAVTFSGASGVTLTSIDSLVALATQYGMASIIKTDIDTWQLVGALE